MPDLYGNLSTLLVCASIMAGAQLIYATVGFGAGMFAVSLMAIVVPDLTGVVVVLLLLTFVTEVMVLAKHWRRVRLRLLAWLVPGMIVGLYVGTRILITCDVGMLKRLLGLVVMAAGLYFAVRPGSDQATDPTTTNRKHPRTHARYALPAGLLSGLLGAMFGTGGPPVIIYLRASGLDKTAFRATILMVFLLMSLFRAVTYTEAGLFTMDRLVAAVVLLPGSIIGIILGMKLHHRLSQRRFAQLVSALLVCLGTVLVAGVGR